MKGGRQKLKMRMGHRDNILAGGVWRQSRRGLLLPRGLALALKRVSGGNAAVHVC